VNHSTTTPALGDLIPASMVCLVDLDGLAVPTAEKDIPEVRPDPTPADSWPRWTDLAEVGLGPPPSDAARFAAFAGARLAAILVGDDDAMERADDAKPEPDGFAAALRDLERVHSIGDIPESFQVIEPASADAPDADWYHPQSPNHPALKAAGLAPVSGGSDEAEPFEPSEADWADYRRWSAGLERRRSLADLGRHAPDALARINLALYGTTEPAHA
jgi:hypothetical protein